jgi:hypothetical protein
MHAISTNETGGIPRRSIAESNRYSSRAEAEALDGHARME